MQQGICEIWLAPSDEIGRLVGWKPAAQAWLAVADGSSQIIDNELLVLI